MIQPFPRYSVIALLDSSLRWNDNEEKTSGLPFRQLLCHSCRIPDLSPFVIPAQAGIQWLIESIPARAGMTIHEVMPASVTNGIHLTP